MNRILHLEVVGYYIVINKWKRGVLVLSYVMYLVDYALLRRFGGGVGGIDKI